MRDKLHLGTSCAFRYNPAIMNPSVLLCLAVCAADPSLVLSEAGNFGGPVVIRRAPSQTMQPDFVTTDSTAYRSDPFIAKTSFSLFQSTVSDEEDDASLPPRFSPRLPSAPFVQGFAEEFVTETNPFSDTEPETLPSYYDPFGYQESYGTNGFQAYRLGWVTYHDAVVMPYAPVSGGAIGSMQMVEWNASLRYGRVVAPGILFNGTGWFNAHYWNGPNNIDLPGQVDQISTDLELGFFNDGPWSGQVAFHPQLVDDYEARINRYAFNFDFRAIAMYRASPNWSFVGGLAFWDRVDRMFVPHVGVIWTPNERWEFRLLFPQTRISYYLGNVCNADAWLYGLAEYTAEAWQANIGTPMRYEDRIQITDERLMLGLRADKGRHSFFVEAGYVFDRQAKFIGQTPKFTIGDVGMIRVGTRY
jgi:hypothetical protein